MKIIFFVPISAGVAKGKPLGKTISPPFFAAAARRPESSMSGNSLTVPAQPPMPCFGCASETYGERGERYSFRKICVTQSLKNALRSTVDQRGSAGGETNGCESGIVSRWDLPDSKFFIALPAH